MEELVHKDSVRVGLTGSVFVLRYDDTATQAAAKMLDDVLVRRFDASPGAQWAIVVVIDASHPPPDPETRAAISKSMKGRGPRVAALAYVVVGSGFRAGTIRAALVGLNLLSQSEYPKKVFAQPADAVTWIAATAPQVLTSADVTRTKTEVEQFIASASATPAPASGGSDARPRV